MKRTFILASLILSILAMTACAGGSSTTATLDTGTITTFDEEDTSDVITSNDGTINFDTTGTADDGNSLIVFEGDENSASVTIEGTTVTISGEGTYVLSGTSEDVQIVIVAPSNATVTLVLDNAVLTSSEGPVITAESSDKLIINLKDGTENILTDSASSTSDLRSLIFSNDDITINGTGNLTLNANAGNGVNTDDDLVITNGTIVIDAANDGLKANDSISITEASLDITSGNDALHVENTEDSTQGNLYVESGNLTLRAYGDGFDASNTVTILGGSLDIISGSGNSNVDSVSGKGIKGSGSVQIGGGTLTITSKDDAIHSEGTVLIAGGTFAISSSDDGIHAETTLTLSGGEVTITKSYEGLEALDIVIAGGSHHITASDDGLNGAGGNDGSGTYPWGGGGMEASNATLTISGGYLYVNAKGDGVDSNGSITMTGGTVIVSGPTDSGNGPLDYTTTFTVTGGLFAAAGSSGMAQNISSGSSQCGVLIYFTSSSSSLIRIEDASGEEILTFQPEKTYQCLLICSPDLAKGETYSVYTGGTVSSYGSLDHGFYTDAVYLTGTLFKSFTISAVATTVGTGGMMRP